MIPLSPATRIYLAAQPQDLRKSFEGLSDLVSHHFQQDPLSGHLYVFTNRRKNRIKLLYADGSGLWLCAKRLHGQGTFAWPRTDESGALQILAQDLALLLSGIDLGRTAQRSWWRRANTEA
jgi:transposase